MSGPLADRIDLKIEVPALPAEEFGAASTGEPSASIRARIESARASQVTRQGCANALLGAQDTETYCSPCIQGDRLLRSAIARLSLSARAYHRILRVARSIADLGFSPHVDATHIAEAIQYRRLDPAF